VSRTWRRSRNPSIATPLLLNAAKSGMGPDEIARQRTVTVEMPRFRYNTTGVSKQVQTRVR
jgi:hypothetical protein